MDITDPTRRLASLLTGYQLSQALYVAAKLGIADLLDDSSKHVDQLAAATSTHGPTLYRLLRALSGFGIFVERPGRVFELSVLAMCLRQNSPQSVKATAILRGEDYYRTWGELLFSVQTGTPSFDSVFGMSNWDYRRAHPEAAIRFNASMSEMARLRSAGLLTGYRFSREVVVDVGGGDGTLLCAILDRHDDVKGILFDQPHVIEQARRQLTPNALKRCQLSSGNFFQEVPSGGNLYILSAVLHDWSDVHAQQILRRCAAAMPEAGTLLIIERVIPPANEPSPALLADLDMLVNNGGCERDEQSWKDLLHAAGLRLTSVAPANAGFFILHAVLDNERPGQAVDVNRGTQGTRVSSDFS